MIAITTGRKPTQSTRRLSRELARFLPGTRRLVRGKLGLRQLVEELIATGSSRLVVIYRRFGGPDRLELMKLEGRRLQKTPPTVILQNVKFVKTVKTGRGVKLECITADSNRASRLAEALSNFLRLPLVDHETSNFEYSLHISGDSKYLEIAPTDLSAKEIMGFVMWAKELRW